MKNIIGEFLILRSVMDKKNLDMIILTSMHNIAYYTGFILLFIR